MDNAFDKLLATFESNYQVSLHFGDQRRMLVTVREASLEEVSEAVHPAARSHSYLSLRATYTVGKIISRRWKLTKREHFNYWL